MNDNNRPRLRQRALLLLGVLLAACNAKAPEDRQPATAPAPAAPAAACARLTEAQAAQLLALPATRAMPDRAENCTWSSGREDTPFPLLNLSVNRLDDEASAAKLFEATAHVQSKLNVEVNRTLGQTTLSAGRAPQGLGDEAWLQTDDLAGADTALLVIRAGRSVYTVSVVGMGKTQGLAERLEAIGRYLVAAR
ncbi:hypothetical protein [Roseateles puraquae]|jgi:hypothetical protein|uniref:DUF3558 domain-containing protein n=1 Tax=Roseateles puraquae TaxID=431059 RepID=A0A254NA63_9BURK|nr:hypothetical protein [Roseateles puraquae]MDG0855580.1 hypothetical protein [Roseateles puraquae]OWR04630.1 hypothetical protein CDO81_08590 [Roseateles puraquae]